MNTDFEYPWPQLGLKAFEPSSSRYTAANLKWWGMGTTESYADGFKKAIERIITTLHSIDDPQHPDVFFYPLAFLARHYFELMLKHLIIQASELVPPQVTAADLSATHSLDFLWRKLRPSFETLWPNGPQDDLDAVESVLLEFHQLDPSGVAFRYDSDKKGLRHSDRLPDIVDLDNLWQTVRAVAALFEGCSAAIQDGIENSQH